MASSFMLPGIRTNFSSIGIAIVMMISIFSTMNGVQVKALGNNCTSDTDCVLNEECSGDTDKKCACQNAPDITQVSDSCKLPGHGEQCESTCDVPFQCDVGSKTCQCSISQYYINASKNCENKKGIGEACNETVIQCFSQFECRSQVCQCKEEEFSPDNLTCKSRKAYNAPCAPSIEHECKQTLTCIDEKCGCTLVSHYYDLLAFNCSLRKDHNESCFNSSNECKSTLLCVSGKCTCDRIEYFNGTICQTRKDKDEVCFFPNECKSTLLCGNGTCACDESEFFNGTICQKKKAYNASCTLSSEHECKQTLTCIDGKCGCTLVSHYYDLLTFDCQLKKSYGVGCDTTQECLGSLSCLSKVCTCNSLTHYREGNECKNKKSYGVGCDTTQECLGSLSCLSKVCTCNSLTHYREGNECKNKKSYGVGCDTTQECLGSLSCLSKVCTCNSLTHYREGNECKNKKSYDVGCDTTQECLGTLSCLGKVCTCNSATHYREGNECKNTRTKSCSNRDNECLENLDCLNYVCACKTTRYLDGSGDCKLKKSSDESCDDTKECLGTLSCLDKVCTCESTTKYLEGNECKNKKSSDESCDDTKECLGKLSCLGKVCTCESTTQYRDGNDCKNKIRHAERCGDDKECFDNDAECRKSRDGLVKCLCKSDFFYNSQGSKTCVALSKLNVLTPTVTKLSTDTIEMTWSYDSNRDPSTKYKINYSPTDGSWVVQDSGGRLSGLIPGTKYAINIESYIPANDNYDRKSTSVRVTPDTWTFPSKPGPYDPTQSELLTQPTIFVFTAAIGNVEHYIVVLNLGDLPVRSGTVSENKFTSFSTQLLAATTYSYSITSVNGNGDKSEPRTGIFTTNAAASDKVQDFAIIDKTADTVELEWKPPSNPNGQIQFFFVQISKNGSCVAASYFECSDCASVEVPDYLKCGQPKFEGNFTTSEVEADDRKFELTLDSLTTYTEYNVTVFAINDAGPGASDVKPFRTDESAAKDLFNLSVTSFRDNSNESVGLNVAWTPDIQTGQTNYTISVMDDETVVRNVVLEGYEENNKLFENVLAFHEYRVIVYAETKIGRSNPITKDIISKTAIPGTVSDLNVIPDTTYAKRFNLKFTCPPKSEWKGIIEGFSVIKIDTSNKQTQHDFYASGCTGTKTVSNTQLGDFEIKINYTFKVKTKNQDFYSAPSTEVQFDVTPKAPVFERQVLTENSNLAATKDTISLSLDSSLITNDQQGEILYAGIIVCVKSKTNNCVISRRKRATMTVTSYQSYINWAQAKSNGFKDHYRTTPDTWLATLKRERPNTFVIGENPKCPETPAQLSYCNGPLPSGKEIIVTVVSCTEAGCQSQSASGFVIKTKAVSDSGDDPAGIIAGVVVAVILLIAIAVAVFIFLRIRRRRQEEPTHLPFKDLSDPHKKPIKIREFKDQVAALHKDQNLLFQGEFEDIKTISADFKFTSNEEAQRECNRVKNRYVDILPYDHSRVKLRFSSENEDGSDFINASYIPGLNSKREYIASQGPMHATIPDFWKMVWEQKSKVIVMLSDLMENNKMKVNLYWPENLNEPISYGDVVVEMTNFSQLNKYIIRNFKVSVGNMNRRVTHFFIPGWWDFSANLTFDDVLEFAQLVRKETTPPDSGPLVVHCSAGVGRTGTFIALDYFMQYIERHSLDDEIDVFEYVIEMRKNRPRMVQAETQYIFIFDALVEVIERKIKAEQERIYDNLRPVEENVYANQMVTEPVYANANVTAENSTTVDFSYANEGFEPDDNFENVDLNSDNKPTTVL